MKRDPNSDLPPEHEIVSDILIGVLGAMVALLLILLFLATR